MQSISEWDTKLLISKKDAITCKQIHQSFTDVCDLCVVRYEHFHFLPHKNMQWNFTERQIHFFWLNGYWKSSHKQLFLLGKQNYDKMIRPISIWYFLLFDAFSIWNAFSLILFPFTNSRVDISALNIYCGQSSFSITARYPDWVNEIMGEALWREICLIVNKPKRNVRLKSITGQVHCKREKCCAYEPFTGVSRKKCRDPMTKRRAYFFGAITLSFP